MLTLIGRGSDGQVLKDGQATSPAPKDADAKRQATKTNRQTMNMI